MALQTPDTYDPDFAPLSTDFDAIAVDLRNPTINQNHGGFNIAAVGQLAFSTGGGITQDAWVAPTLLNSWVNYGGGVIVAGYRINRGTGKLELHGSIKSGTYANGTVLFNVPAGFRPTSLHVVGGAIHNDGTAFKAVGINVDATGNVTLWGATGNLSLALDNVALDLS